MPATPVLALPYPGLSDTADVPRDIQALAVKLDGYTSLRPPLVTALPGSPVDGQECYFQNAAMATAGIVWHLRYRAAAAGAYKWECTGGPGLYATITTFEQTPGTGNSFAEVTTPGPDIAVPLAGDYDYDFSAIAAPMSGASSLAVGLAVGTGVQPTSNEQASTYTGVSQFQTIAQAGRLTGVAAGTTLRLRYVYGAVILGYGNRRVHLAPVRVG